MSLGKRNKFEKLGINERYTDADNTNRPSKKREKFSRYGRKAASTLFGDSAENVPEKEHVSSRFAFTREKRKPQFENVSNGELNKPENAPFILVLVSMCLVLLGSALLSSDLFMNISGTAAHLAVAGVNIAAYAAPALIYILSSSKRMKLYNIRGFSPGMFPLSAAMLGVLLCSTALQKYFLAYTFSYSVPVTNGTQSLLSAIFVSALVPAVCEELLVRGVVQYELTKYAGGITGVLAGALMFAFLHFDLQYFMIYLCAGIILGILTHVTHSVFPAVIVHFFNNIFSVLLSDRLSFVATERIGGSFLMIVLSVLGFVVLLIALQMIEKICTSRAVSYGGKKQETQEDVLEKDSYGDETIYFTAREGNTAKRFFRVLSNPYMLASEALFLVVVICKLSL